MRAFPLLTMTVFALAAGSPAGSDKKPSAAKVVAATKAAAEKATQIAKPALAVEKICKKNELRLQPICKTGAKCAALCLPKPSRAGGLCPDGLGWEKLPCPINARCLLGGRCVSPAKAATTATGSKGPAPKVVKPPKATVALGKCGVGRVPTQVMCFRAPCPTLCLPARLDPSLKESPKVKPL